MFCQKPNDSLDLTDCLMSSEQWGHIAVYFNACNRQLNCMLTYSFSLRKLILTWDGHVVGSLSSEVFIQNEPVKNKCWLLIFCFKAHCNPLSHLVCSHFLLYTWTKCLPISFYMTGVCIISVSMAAGVPRRGHLSPVIALVQDTVELRAITVGLRNGFLHFKHTYCSFIMCCSLSKFP